MVELRNKKARALLALLALAPAGRRRGRAELATLLWGHTGEQRARHNLRQCVAAIRRALDPDGDRLLATDGEELVLSAAIDVDVERLESELDSGDPQRIERALHQLGVELMSDFFLDLESFDDWLDNQRHRLRKRACQACERLADHHQQQGNADGALAAVRRWLDVDEACEVAHRLAMTLLAQTDRRSEALSQYDRCTEALARHFDAEPQPETTVVYQAIRDGKIEVQPAPQSSRPTTRGGEQQVAPTLALPQLPSVAVLPFENLGSEDDRYYADGIAEDIITELTRFGTLMVIARHSSFSYRKRALSVPEIAAELGVQYIVDGSVRRGSQQLQISVHLVDGPSGRHVWANRYQAAPEGVFEVEAEVLQTIVATLAGRVETARLRALKRDSAGACAAAHDYVLRGKEAHHRGGLDGARAAIEMFSKAIELDGEYALAHAWLSCALGLLMAHDAENAPAILERSTAAATRARELDDDEGECHRLLAAINIIKRRFDLAEYHQQRALALNPNDDRIVCQMGELLSLQGRPAEGLPWVDKAMRLNPFHGDNFWWHRGRILYQLGRYDEARRDLDHIARPSLGALAVAAACSGADGVTPEPRVERVYAARPEFRVETFIASLPLACEKTAASLRTDLLAAGLRP